MALVSTSTTAGAVAALPRSGQRATSSPSFLGGKTLLRQAAAEAARPSFAVRAAADPDRPIWFPGSTPPPWLDGSLPGDFGFDPWGLGEL
jgi:light-harvesting complex I chlorophyll a/b binding protein 2